MVDTSTHQLGDRLSTHCDRCTELRLVTVTDAGAFCFGCLREMLREGMFENLLSFEREALGLAWK
jgi:hypothetical protein